PGAVPGVEVVDAEDAGQDAQDHVRAEALRPDRGPEHGRGGLVLANLAAAAGTGEGLGGDLTPAIGARDQRHGALLLPALLAQGRAVGAVGVPASGRCRGATAGRSSAGPPRRCAVELPTASAGSSLAFARGR